MKLLIDTHILLWGLTDPDRLPADVLRMIRAPDDETYVSVVCLWEIAIKSRSGRLRAPDDLPRLVAEHPDYRILAIDLSHVWRVRQLPRLHGDPFDQLLVAQALVEGMTIVTHDRMIPRYAVPVIMV